MGFKTVTGRSATHSNKWVTERPATKCMNIFFALLALLYPLLVYYGLIHFSVRTTACTLAALLLLRFFSAKLKSSLDLFLPLTLMGLLLTILSALYDREQFLLIYPCLMNVTAGLLFLSSLFSPRSLIERFALLREPNLSNQARAYCRKVTIVWVGFFVVNGLLSLTTILLTTREVWAFYNGFLSYLLMALLGMAEYSVRRRIKLREKIS